MLAPQGPLSWRLPILLLVLLAPAIGQAPEAASGPPRVRPDGLVVLPEAVASFGAAVHEGDLFVLGGHVGRAHQHSRDNLCDALLRSADGGRTWERLPGGVALQSVALVAARDGLVRIGGMQARNAPGEAEDLHSVADVARYDAAAGAWVPLVALPAGRSSHDAVVTGSSLVVAGGWTLAGEDAAWRDEALILDLHAPADGWRALPQPFRRRALALAAWRGEVFAIGGLDESGRPSTRVDVLDPATGAWRVGPPLPSPGFGAAAVGARDGLFVGLLDGSILRLDAEGRAWEIAGRALFPRFFHRLVETAPGRLASIGGAGRLGHLATVELAGVTTDDAADGPAIVTLRIPHAGFTRNRQAIVRERNVLRFLGGNRSDDQHAFEPGDFADEGFALDLATLRIRAAAPLPAARQSMVAVADGRATLLLGGFGHDGDVARSQDAVLALDADGACAAAGRLPAPLTQFGAAMHADRLWIFGGLDYDPGRGAKAFRHRDAILVGTFDEAGRPRFEPAAFRLPVARRAFAGALLGDVYHLIGGFTDGFRPVEDALAIDLVRGTVRPLPAPAPRVSAELVPFDGRLALVGGLVRDDDGALGPARAVEVYDPATATWSVLVARLPCEVRHLRALALEGRLLLITTGVPGGGVELTVVAPQS